MRYKLTQHSVVDLRGELSGLRRGYQDGHDGLSLGLLVVGRVL